MRVKITRSPNPKKKFRAVLEDGRTVDFGASGYSNYTKHKNPSRMRAYVRRHGGKISMGLISEQDPKKNSDSNVRRRPKRQRELGCERCRKRRFLVPMVSVELSLVRSGGQVPEEAVRNHCFALRIWSTKSSGCCSIISRRLSHESFISIIAMSTFENGKHFLRSSSWLCHVQEFRT